MGIARTSLEGSRLTGAPLDLGGDPPTEPPVHEPVPENPPREEPAPSEPPPAPQTPPMPA